MMPAVGRAGRGGHRWTVPSDGRRRRTPPRGLPSRPGRRMSGWWPESLSSASSRSMNGKQGSRGPPHCSLQRRARWGFLCLWAQGTQSGRHPFMAPTGTRPPGTGPGDSGTLAWGTTHPAGGPRQGTEVLGKLEARRPMWGGGGAGVAARCQGDPPATSGPLAGTETASGS